jgi:phosphodiesterase/alkaline phosphatase D-like protein
MGNGMVDGSLQHWEQQASLDTTRQIYKHINDTDVLFHIGDISYAVGYAGEVHTDMVSIYWCEGQDVL